VIENTNDGGQEKTQVFTLWYNLAANHIVAKKAGKGN
jgi:hypothetical protein